VRRTNADCPSCAAARLFDGPTLEWEDRRKDYGEIRINTLGEIEGRVFFVSITRREQAVRIISFHKANAGEARRTREHFGARSEGGKD